MSKCMCLDLTYFLLLGKPIIDIFLPAETKAKVFFLLRKQLNIKQPQKNFTCRNKAKIILARENICSDMLQMSHRRKKSKPRNFFCIPGKI